MSARLVIAAPRSGEGKTSVALGIAWALKVRGAKVASAKVGPDYLDTGWHSLVTGRPARNLDVWTMGERGVLRAAAASAAGRDVMVIEGVMGLHDGHRTGAAPCSTADMAVLLQAPVILVLDASRSSASLAAVAYGLAAYDSRVTVAGVVLNRFGSHRSRTAVQAAFDRVKIPVLGWVPPEEAAALPSRHLGLVASTEDEQAASAAVEVLGRLIESHVDMDAVARISCSPGPLPEAPPLPTLKAQPPVPPTIAVARDDAFGFYYEDGLDVLRGFGARLVEFSPLADARLPEGVSGVYLGGGYPELFAERLADNVTMRECIAAASRAGMPVYAECGGMLYLLESLTDDRGAARPMVGVIHARGSLTGRLQRMGYVEASLAADCVLGRAGTTVRGHEFRYSVCEPHTRGTPAWMVDGMPHGFIIDNTVASYLHLNFAGCPQVAAAFVAACAAYAAAQTRPAKETR